MKTFLLKIHYKLSTEQLKKHFHEVDKAFARQLDFEGFLTFYLKLLNSDTKFFSENLNSYTSDAKRVTLKEFISFLKNEQKDEMYLNEGEVSRFMLNYLLDPMRHYEIDPYFTLTEFIDFLFSKRNSVWDTKYDNIYQDMTQPLTHYWIATSHNTYLSGDQYKSESSVECYARCLRMGCRCIECMSKQLIHAMQ
jgi:phosphatidylinositol phospholipase C gamma-1